MTVDSATTQARMLIRRMLRAAVLAGQIPASQELSAAIEAGVPIFRDALLAAHAAGARKGQTNEAKK